MLKVLPAIEGFVLANIATRNLFNSGPVDFLLGDLNDSIPPYANALQIAMGPSEVNAISLKELLTGSMNRHTEYASGAGGMVGGVLAEVQSNFMDNMGNIIIGTVASTAGFRIARKVLRKPINMANRQLKNMGLAGTIQF